MLIQITAVVTALIGIVGLGVDIGFITLERRILQNAVDAASVSGARDLVEPTINSGTTTYTTAATVNAMANKNNIPAGTILTCEYVSNSNTVTEACSSAPSSTAAGVKVSASHTRDNLFMRVLGIPTSTVAAEGTARASAMTSYSVPQSLFIVCGFDTFTQKHQSTGPGTFVPDPALEGDILLPLPTNPVTYEVNSWALNKWFIIHDEQVQDQACQYTNSGFKGLLDKHQTGYVALDHNLLTELIVDTGTQAGPTREAVTVEGGCPLANDWDAGPAGCKMMVPVAVSSPANQHMNAWCWLEFLIVRGDFAVGNTFHPELNIPGLGSNSHVGKLVSLNAVHRYDPNANYGTWSAGIQSGPVVVRQVN